ncbi:spore germination protein GerPC [Caldibacillus debilis]|uniref:spore germination protein GerPC n=1 Tax=Caldibacillus debilis TaxID=301148 RepID=UPI0023F2D0FF|nr:spore germination protein GerPC [Caldibacillus debilis]
MSREIIQYIHQLHAYIKSQEQKMKELEKEIGRMKSQLSDLSGRPPVHIDKIDYHFDQLKIERLEGTLTIGLNPNDLQNTDELLLGNLPPFVGKDPEKTREDRELAEKIEKSVNAFLDEQLETIVEKATKQLQMETDPSMTKFIREDIRRQLRGQIDSYLQSFRQKHGELPEAELEKQIREQIAADINRGVYAFLSAFRNP